MKNSNDTIENRNRNLPACSAVSQIYMYAVCTLSLEFCVPMGARSRHTNLKDRLKNIHFGT